MVRHWSGIVIMGCAIAATLVFGGCRRGAKAEVTASATTTGQELKDLEDARAKGLISADEYNTQRKRILERN